MIGNIIWRIVLVILIALIMRSMYFVGLDIYYTAQSVDWPSVNGRVLEFSDANNATQPRYWRKDEIVRYEYSIASQNYNGSTISFNRRKKWQLDDVKTLTETWRHDDKIVVFYNPENPGMSVLKPGGANFSNIAFFCSQVFGVVCLAGLLRWSTKFEKRPPEKGGPSLHRCNFNKPE